MPDTLSFHKLHSLFFPVSINPYHFDYNSVARVPRLENSIGFENESKNVKSEVNLEIDYWATDSEDVQDSITFGVGLSYISLFNDYVNATMGFQEYAWGSSLGFNPTDKVNNFDYRYGVESERVTNLSLSLALYPKRFVSIEAVYVPIYTGDTYAIDLASHFQEELEEQLSDQLKSSNFNANVEVNKQNLAFDFYQYQAAVRTKFYLPFADVAFSYIYDIDDFYSIDTYEQATDSSTATQNVSYDLLHRRINRFGFDIAGAVGATNLWLETALNLSEDYALDLPKVRNPNTEWTVGLDFNTGPDDDIHVGVQQMGKYIIGYDRTTDFSGSDDAAINSRLEYQNNTLAGETEGLRLGLFANLDWSLLDDKMKPILNGGYFFPLLYDESSYFRYGSVAVLPSIEFSPVESYVLTVGSQISYSWIEQENGDIVLNEADSFGANVENNLVYIAFKYQWAK